VTRSAAAPPNRVQAAQDFARNAGTSITARGEGTGRMTGLGAGTSVSTPAATSDWERSYGGAGEDRLTFDPAYPRGPARRRPDEPGWIPGGRWVRLVDRAGPGWVPGGCNSAARSRVRDSPPGSGAKL
jgi:hypothetical protein